MTRASGRGIPLDGERLYEQADRRLDEGRAREAVRLLRQGAEMGSYACADRLGCCYADAEGVRRDPARAIRWLLTARARGSGIAAENLAVVYADLGRWKA